MLDRPGRRARALAAAADAGVGLPPVLDALQSVGRVAQARTLPTPDYRQALRTRLVAVASVSAAPASVAASSVTASSVTGSSAVASRPAQRPSHRHQRRLTVLVGSLAGTVALAGVGVAAQQSLPGDPLYVLKRSVDDVRMAVGGPSSDYAVASGRMGEIQQLVRHDAPASTVTSALTSLDTLIRRVAGEASPADRSALTSTARDQLDRLQALMPDLPAGALPAAQTLRGTLTTLLGIPDDAGTGGAGGGLPGTTTPSSGLLPGGLLPGGLMPGGLLPGGGVVPWLPALPGLGTSPSGSPTPSPGASASPTAGPSTPPTPGTSASPRPGPIVRVPSQLPHPSDLLPSRLLPSAVPSHLVPSGLLPTSLPSVPGVPLPSTLPSLPGIPLPSTLPSVPGVPLPSTLPSVPGIPPPSSLPTVLPGGISIPRSPAWRCWAVAPAGPRAGDDLPVPRSTSRAFCDPTSPIHANVTSSLIPGPDPRQEYRASVEPASRTAPT